MGESIAEAVFAPGPVRGVSPLVAWARFWTQCWRFSGRASRSEFLWCVAAEAVIAYVLCLSVPHWAGLPTHWTFFVDPFGAVPSIDDHIALRMSQTTHSWWGLGGGDHVVTPTSYDFGVLCWLAVTALPRLTLLVRRLHDRDRSGTWWVALVLLGPLGWIIVTVMVLGAPRPGGVRFDPGPWTGRVPRNGLVTTVAG